MLSTESEAKEPCCSSSRRLALAESCCHLSEQLASNLRCSCAVQSCKLRRLANFSAMPDGWLSLLFTFPCILPERHALCNGMAAEALCCPAHPTAMLGLSLWYLCSAQRCLSMKQLPSLRACGDDTVSNRAAHAICYIQACLSAERHWWTVATGASWRSTAP